MISFKENTLKKLRRLVTSREVNVFRKVAKRVYLTLYNILINVS